MTTEIKIGSTVTAPITDKDGEMSYVIGKLIDLNKRYATIERDGETFKIGKTKIELVEQPKKKSEYTVIGCPKCGSPSHKETASEGFDRKCSNGECGYEFNIGSRRRIADHYKYGKVIAASGRASVDTGDEVAIMLRGRELDEVYEIVADWLDTTIADLKARYQHLNPGHQRMNLGNKLRGHLRRTEKNS